MKNLKAVALILGFSAATVYAQQAHLTFSGSGLPSTVVLQNGVATSEYHFAGNGALGPFTFSSLSASAPAQPPLGSGCVFYGSVVAGGGVFRFQDGSLLMVNSAQGTDCIQFTPSPMAHCIRIFQIVGGTGRFQNLPPGGSITLDETLVPVLTDQSGNPILFAATGTGTFSGIHPE